MTSIFKYFFRGILLLTIVSLGGSKVFAQHYMVLNQWRQVRHEVAITGGAGNFLGDLGGLDKVASPFVWDLELSLTKLAFGVSYRYYLARTFAWRHDLNYGTVMGDDKLTAEQFRNNRNLNFRSRIFEYDFMFEWYFGSESDKKRYGLKNVKGKKIGMNFRSFQAYLTAGVGVFYFNPKADLGSGYVALHPLHTEGQFLPDGPEQYKRVSIAFPVGGGLRYGFDRQWAVSLELVHRFTLSDYIDDVSGYYYDNAAIANAYGATAAYAADPSLRNPQLIALAGTNPTNAGYQRGDETDKDGFMYAKFGLHYKFKSKYKPYGGSVKKIKKGRRYSKTKF